MLCELSIARMILYFVATFSESSQLFGLLGQSWNMRYQLVDPQGNFGSIDSDPPAAMRYTEARMTRIDREIVTDLDKETVDFVPNYDNSQTEPSVMPSRVPTLLVNGSSGIAVGMATNIPPHNLNEVVNAALALKRKRSPVVEQDIEAVDIAPATRRLAESALVVGNDLDPLS